MSRLGRGLSSLISEQNNTNPFNNDSGIAVKSIATAKVNPGAMQPRRKFDEEKLKELTASIKQHGVIQPILVRKSKRRSTEYDIIAGERRYLAATRLGLREIPAIALDIDDKEALEIGLIENIQRADLTSLEEAEGYKKLIKEFAYTQEELSDIIGKSRSNITNSLRLLDLPAQIKQYLDEGILTKGHARALLNSNYPTKIADEIIQKGLNVRQAERLVKKTNIPHKPKSIPDKINIIKSLEQNLTSKLGLRTKIKEKNGAGTITLRYKTHEELVNLMQMLK